MKFKLRNIDSLLGILENQIDNLGRYHYFGIVEKDRPSLFLGKESGDMTYHIGILLQFVPKLDKALIEKILPKLFNYLDLVSVKGFPGREVLYKEEYEIILLPNQKHCEKSTFLGIDSGVCNKWVQKNDFMVRYDISVDSISSLVAGLYYIYKYLPNYRDNVKALIKNMYLYYKNNNFTILDLQTNKPVRFGNHNPNIFPMAYLIWQMISILLGEKIPYNGFMNFLVQNIRTYIPNILLSKKDRLFYNNYMFMMILAALYDYFLETKENKVNYKKALENLLKESRGEHNIYNLAISLKYSLEYEKDTFLLDYFYSDLDSFIVDGEYILQKVSAPTIPFDRPIYNRFEKSPYQKGVYKIKDIYYCNEDLLQAYFFLKN